MMNVPSLGVTKELLEQLSLYGEIEEYRILYDYPCDEFTEVYWVRYRGIDSARAAKRRMDSRPFFSNLLHICYAPEFEDIKETKEKLEQRRVTVMKKLRIKSNKERKFDSIGTRSVEGQSNFKSLPNTSSSAHCSGVIGDVAHPEGMVGGVVGDIPGNPILPLLPPPPVVVATEHTLDSTSCRRLPGNIDYPEFTRNMSEGVFNVRPTSSSDVPPISYDSTSSSFHDYNTPCGGHAGAGDNEKGKSEGLSLQVRKELHKWHTTPNMRWGSSGNFPHPDTEQKTPTEQKLTLHSKQQRGKGKKIEKVESYFTFHEQPPPNGNTHVSAAASSRVTDVPLSGSISVDQSIMSIRRTIGEVMKPVTMATEQKEGVSRKRHESKPKRRKRI